jgi:hypothetical protein
MKHWSSLTRRNALWRTGVQETTGRPWRISIVKGLGNPSRLQVAKRRGSIGFDPSTGGALGVLKGSPKEIEAMSRAIAPVTGE